MLVPFLLLVLIVDLPKQTASIARFPVTDKDRARALVQARDGKPSTQVAFNYNYEHHGNDWKMGTCWSRTMQSPIDIPGGGSPEGFFHYHYDEGSTSYELVHTGTNMALELQGLDLGGIRYDHTWYDLLNINAHVQSEHTWAGLHSQGELHLVHKSYYDGHLLIVAIPFEAPPTEAPTAAPTSSEAALLETVNVAPASASEPELPVLQAFLKAKLPPPGESVLLTGAEAQPMALNALFEGDQASFYAYEGSTTSPPCAEAVSWLVASNIIKVSPLQVELFLNATYALTSGYGNNRAVMPLNGRKISLIQAAPEDARPTEALGFTVHTPPPSERAIAAQAEAAAALRVTREASHQAGNLYDAELAASRAEAKVWAGSASPASAPAR